MPRKPSILTIISLAIKLWPKGRSTRRYRSWITVTTYRWWWSRRERWQVITISQFLVIGILWIIWTGTVLLAKVCKEKEIVTKQYNSWIRSQLWNEIKFHYIPDGKDLLDIAWFRPCIWGTFWLFGPFGPCGPFGL